MDGKEAITLNKLLTWWMTLLKLLGVVYSQLTLDDTEGGDFCWGEQFEADCTGKGFILMLSAQYGRLRIGKCIGDASIQIGCQISVLDYIDRNCSGRVACSIPVSEVKEIGQTGPNACSRDVVGFLEAIYKCINASVGDRDSCDTDGTTYLTGNTGYISSTALISNFFGTDQCPFTITVQHGQIIEFGLNDFTLKDSKIITNTEQTCPVEAVFTEDGLSHREDLCGDSHRERKIYLSRNFRVSVHFILKSSNADVPLFFLNYNAIGCPHYKASVNTSVERDGIYTTVTCNFTGDTWTFECRNTDWVIQDGNSVENCTKEIAAERNKSDTEEDDDFPWGILIAVGIGIALGTIVGLSLLGLVFLCRKYCCPDKTEPRRQDSARLQIAREVPPMTDLITEASLLAKQGQPIRRPPSHHYAPQQFGPGVPHTVSASIEYNPAGPHGAHMMRPDMHGRAAATLPRPRSVDSISDHIYESYKYRTGETGSMISESSSAEQLQTLGAASIATATLPLQVAPPPVAPKPTVPRQSSQQAPSEASTSTSHPVASEETVTDTL